MADDQHLTVEQLQAELRALQERHAAALAENAALRGQQAATAEVLRVIASSPAHLQGVLDTIAKRAALLCDGGIASIHRIDDEANLYLAAVFAADPVRAARPWGTNDRRPISQGTVTGRAVLVRRTIHVHDLAAAVESDYAESRRFQHAIGNRTVIATPLLRDGEAIGAVTISRWQVRPFTPQQIALLEAFADQAVIAIENARLFEELQQRNQDLSDALEQQSATAEVLRVIASAPTEFQTVIDAVLATALRLSGSTRGFVCVQEDETLRVIASTGDGNGGTAMRTGHVIPMAVRRTSTRAVLERRTIHVRDHSDPAFLAEFPDASNRRATASLTVPLLHESVAIGVFTVDRDRAQPYDSQQIALIEMFASQAAIAIQNARLFEELQERNAELSEALEQQTATAEILRVIASSQSALEPVFQSMAERAYRLCDATSARVWLVDGDVLRIVTAVVASDGAVGEAAKFTVPGFSLPLSRQSMSGVAVLEGRVIHIEDSADAGNSAGVSDQPQRTGYRSDTTARATDARQHRHRRDRGLADGVRAVLRSADRDAGDVR